MCGGADGFVIRLLNRRRGEVRDDRSLGNHGNRLGGSALDVGRVAGGADAGGCATHAGAGGAFYFGGMLDLPSRGFAAAEAGPFAAGGRGGTGGAERTRGLLEQRRVEGSLLVAPGQREAGRVRAALSNRGAVYAADGGGRQSGIRGQRRTGG